MSVAQLAQTYGRLGMIEEGLRVLTESLADIHKEGASFYEAEIHRLTGELTLQSQARLGQVSNKSPTGPEEVKDKSHARHSKAEVEKDAEACFLKALAIAQQQHAKSLELRATMSLARLWQSQGKGAEAHHMLSTIYNWFTEGFDTKDLQEAKALLEELSSL
jgi:predicted ATPase